MTEIWRKVVLYVAGAWNVIAGTSALLDPRRHFAQLYTASLTLDEPLESFFYRATWINVIAWGVGYVLAAHDVAQRRPVLLAGAAGKLAYFGAALALFRSGRGSTALLGFTALDVVFAALFLYIGLSRPPARSGSTPPDVAGARPVA